MTAIGERELGGVELRLYQRQAVDGTLAALAKHRSALIVAATGTGKTTVFMAIAKALRPHGRILVVAHRDELIQQARARIESGAALSVAVEMAEARAVDSSADVVVASVQTLTRERRLAGFARDAFGLVIVDEAHHATAATYRRILDHFAGAKVLGVTATPDRLDGRGLGAVFETVPFVYEIRDAIEDGWLVPIRQARVVVEDLDLSRVRRTAGDLNEGDLERILTEDGALHGIAQPLVKHAGDRFTLVFAVTVAHARELAEVLGFYAGPDRVAVVVGADDRELRRRTVRAFAAGEVQFLVNCMVLGEGFDCPSIACVAVARPTASRALYAQMIGRGTRPAPDKRDLLVLDFAGNAGRHHLVSTFDVLSGSADPDVERRAQAAMNAGDVTILDAIAAAEAEIAAERRRAAQLEVRARLVDIDPFTVLGVHAAPGRWGGLPMTDKQRALLERAGLPTGKLDRGQASALIDELLQRSRDRRCTYKQARTLLRFGQDPDVPFEEASRLITAIAANGWRALRAEPELAW